MTGPSEGQDPRHLPSGGAVTRARTRTHARTCTHAPEAHSCRSLLSLVVRVQGAVGAGRQHTQQRPEDARRSRDRELAPQRQPRGLTRTRARDRRVEKSGGREKTLPLSMVARVQLSEREMRMLRSQGAFAFVGALPGPRRLSLTDESGTTRRVSVGGSSRFVVRGSEPPLGLDAAGFSLSDYPGRSHDELGFLKPPLGLDDVGKKVWQKALRLRSNETTGEVRQYCDHHCTIPRQRTAAPRRLSCNTE